MAEKSASPRKRTSTSTKQEMLDAYQISAKRMEEKRASELAPERRAEEKAVQEAVKVAGGVEPEAIDRDIGALKAEIGRVLAELADRLASESSRFRSIQKAVQSKESELKELYGIEKTAVSLAALLEAQNLKRDEFEAEMAHDREALESEMTFLRSEWDKEKKTHEAELKERDTTEKKARDREREEFNYVFKRDQQAIKDKLNDEKTTLEKDLKLRRETAEKDLLEREKVIAGKEREFAELRAKAAAFPKELETAVAAAVKDVADKLRLEAKNREDLLRKEFEGDRNVLAAKNEALEKTNKDLLAANMKLAQQIEAAYQKVQDIAEKTVDGISQAKSLGDLQKLLVEQSRKGQAEKT
jgi:hypothetical protein